MKLISTTAFLILSLSLPLATFASEALFHPEQQMETIYSYLNGSYKHVKADEVNDEFSPGYKFKVVNDLATWKFMTLDGRHWSSSMDLTHPVQRAYHVFLLHGHLQRIAPLPENERELYEMDEEESEKAEMRYQKELGSAGSFLRFQLTDASVEGRPQVVQFRIPLDPDRTNAYAIQPNLTRLKYAFEALQQARLISDFQTTVGRTPPADFHPESPGALDGFWVSDIPGPNQDDPQPVASHLIAIRGSAAEEYIATRDGQVFGELKSKLLLEPNGVLALHTRRVTEGFLGEQHSDRHLHVLSADEKSIQVRCLPSTESQPLRSYTRLTEAGFQEKIDAARQGHQKFVTSHPIPTNAPKEKLRRQKEIIQRLNDIGEGSG